MKIAIVGAGALGLYYGAMLQRSGQDVRFLLRRDYEAVVSQGLKVHSVNGDFHIPVVAGFISSAELGTVDLVIVGLKTFANDQLYTLIEPLLGGETRILTLQNGLGNEEQLAELFGSERVLGGVAFLCSNRGEPGHVHHLSAGRIIIGSYAPESSIWLDSVAAVFNAAAVDCRVTNDLRKVRWEKLVWNIPFNGLCALLQQSVDQLLRVPSCRVLVRELMLEVIAAANSQELSQPIPDSYADSMITFTDGMGIYKPSMQIDREEGRLMEIDALFTIPLAHSAQCGVQLPRIAMLATLLSQLALHSPINLPGTGINS